MFYVVQYNSFEWKYVNSFRLDKAPVKRAPIGLNNCEMGISELISGIFQL